jgi:hypothetical protein
MRTALCVATALLITACGKGTEMTFSKAQVHAFANAVNLREGDLGPPSGAVIGRWYPKRFVEQVMRCGGALPGIEFDGVRSEGYSRRAAESVSSAIRVLASDVAARRAVARTTTAQFRACIVAAYRSVPVSDFLMASLCDRGARTDHHGQREFLRICENATNRVTVSPLPTRCPPMATASA